MSDRAAESSLLEQAKALCGLHTTVEIIAHLCRHAQRLSGATLAIGTIVPPGESFDRASHVRIGAEGPVPPATISAAYALHRRLAQRRVPLVLDAAEPGTEAIFRGMGGAGTSASSIAAVPIVH